LGRRPSLRRPLFSRWMRHLTDDRCQASRLSSPIRSLSFMMKQYCCVFLIIFRAETIKRCMELPFFHVGIRAFPAGINTKSLGRIHLLRVRRMKMINNNDMLGSAFANRNGSPRLMRMKSSVGVVKIAKRNKQSAFYAFLGNFGNFEKVRPFA
jgi:hypothetical protein